MGVECPLECGFDMGLPFENRSAYSGAEFAVELHLANDHGLPWRDGDG